MASNQADGVYAHWPVSRTPNNVPAEREAQRPWELTSQTLEQYRVEEASQTDPWVPPMVPSQSADPFAGAHLPLQETNVRRNNRSENGSFNLGSSDGHGRVSPSGQGDTYMVPPKYGWRSQELGLDDIMHGVMSKLDDPANPANVGYLDDWSGQNGAYQGTEQYSHGEIPQGL
jgi:hypothetical protein